MTVRALLVLNECITCEANETPIWIGINDIPFLYIREGYVRNYIEFGGHKYEIGNTSLCNTRFYCACMAREYLLATEDPTPMWNSVESLFNKTCLKLHDYRLSPPKDGKFHLSHNGEIVQTWSMPPNWEEMEEHEQSHYMEGVKACW